MLAWHVLCQNVVFRLLNRLPCISILTHHVMSKFCRRKNGVLREPSAREAVNPLDLCWRSQNITSGVLLVWIILSTEVFNLLCNIICTSHVTIFPFINLCNNGTICTLFVENIVLDINSLRYMTTLIVQYSILLAKKWIKENNKWLSMMIHVLATSMLSSL